MSYSMRKYLDYDMVVTAHRVSIHTGETSPRPAFVGSLRDALCHFGARGRVADSEKWWRWPEDDGEWGVVSDDPVCGDGEHIVIVGDSWGYDAPAFGYKLYY